MIEIDAEGIDYYVFGGRLRSQLEFPDLSRAPDRKPPYREFLVDESGPPRPIQLLGTNEMAPEWIYKLHRLDDGLLLEYGAVGSFRIDKHGWRLIWYPDAGSEIDPDILLEMARAILLGPVMALALHQSGAICLHGSAVTIGGRAVAFVAPKHHGKSTLALALTAAGARLVTDDLVAIEIGTPPILLPGVHSVRLMADVADLLARGFVRAVLKDGFKRTLTNLPQGSLVWEPAPLEAVYVIRSVVAVPDGGAVDRVLLPPTRATLALAHGKKLVDELVGLREAGTMLKEITKIVTGTPIYELKVVRDIDRLPEVVSEILAWHDGSMEGARRGGA